MTPTIQITIDAGNGTTTTYRLEQLHPASAFMVYRISTPTHIVGEFATLASAMTRLHIIVASQTAWSDARSADR